MRITHFSRGAGVRVLGFEVASRLRGVVGVGLAAARLHGLEASLARLGKASCRSSSSCRAPRCGPRCFVRHGGREGTGGRAERSGDRLREGVALALRAGIRAGARARRGVASRAARASAGRRRGGFFASLRPRKTGVGTRRWRKPGSGRTSWLFESWTRCGSAQGAGRACESGVASRSPSPVRGPGGTPRLHCLDASVASKRKGRGSRPSCRGPRCGPRCLVRHKGLRGNGRG